MQLDSEYGQAYMKTGNVYHFDKHMADSAKFYYHKTIDIYNSVKPRDSRMMAAYSFLGQLFQSEQNYDSATYYFNIFLKEMEPSNMYIRDVSLSSIYKSLFECYQHLSGNYLTKLIRLDEHRIAKNSDDAGFLLGILEENYMSIEQDSVLEHFLIPFAKKIQKTPSPDPYTKIFSTLDECEFLRKLKRYEEARKLLQSMHAAQPKEPWILFELGHEYILEGKNRQGLVYLNEAKTCLNDHMTKREFLELLNNPDFDSVRQTVKFKKFSN